MPNRRFPTPPPFTYHPSLFPQFAAKNPTPFNFVIPSGVKPPRERWVNKISVVAEPKRFDMPASMTPQAFALQTQKYAFRSEKAAEDLDRFQNEVHAKGMAYLAPKYSEGMDKLMHQN